MRRWIAALVVAAALTGCGEDEEAPVAQAATTLARTVATPSTTARPRLPTGADRPLPAVFRGVTTDTAWNVPELTAAIRGHSVDPFVRIVLDPQPRPEAYRPAVEALRPHAYLMALLLDSTALRRFTPAQAAERAEAYVQAYGDRIDLWEIGNELNGSWVGRSPEEINAKVQAAFEVVKVRHDKPVAVTLNFWSGPNCYAKPWEATLDFARGMPGAVRRGTDVVTLSVYETACRPAQRPSEAELGDMLAALSALFPNAKLAIGETGAQGTEDGLAKDPSFAKKKAIAVRSYSMHQDLRARFGERFVGGYFWWYYAEDAVPRRRRQSLWPTIDRLLASLS